MNVCSNDLPDGEKNLTRKDKQMVVTTEYFFVKMVFLFGMIMILSLFLEPNKNKLIYT